MKDFRIVTAKTVLRVSTLAPIRGFLPPSILVVGEKMNLATEVLYNGIQADEYVINSSTRLIVRVPPSQVGKKFTDLKVLSTAALTKTDATVVLGLTKPSRTIAGIDRLIQSFLLVLLTTPGSDIFSPSSGGGAMSIVGRNTTKDGVGVAADLAQAIEKTKQEILRLQSSGMVIPPSEKLLSCSLDAVEFNPDSSVLGARVLLQNMLGDSAQVSMR